MREFVLTVGDEFAGRDIKFILTNHWCFSGNLITLLKKDDGILVNGKKEFVNKVLEKDDVLKINLPQENSENIVPNNIPLDILFEDEDILAVNKPYDMPTHPSIGHFEGTLANAVMHYFKGEPFTFRAITRLDRDTSGVVLLAKNIVSADRLSKSLISGDMQKEYMALCVGTPNPKSARINAPIKREKEGIINHLWEEYELSISAAEEIKTEVENEKESSERLAELKSLIKALGSVNVDSIEEYKAVKERYEFMAEQKKDLEKSKDNLTEIIASMEELSSMKSTRAFQKYLLNCLAVERVDCIYLTLTTF